MCYSAEVSALTFLIGVGGAATMVARGTTEARILGFFLGFVALMQGIEWLLWSHQRCDAWHRDIAVTGMWLNHLQPVVLGALVAWLGDPSARPWVLGITAAYSAIAIPYSLQFGESLRCAQPRCSVGNPHLVWLWNALPGYRIMYAAFLAALIAIPTLGMGPNGFWFGMLAAVLFALSWALYPREAVGALWCFFAAFVPVGYLLLR